MVTVVCTEKTLFLGTEMEQWCKEKGIEILENKELYLRNNLIEISTYDLAIVNTYGKLIKKEIIEALRGRIINVHCAPLPKYRGMYAYNWGIYNGEKEWGVTVHYVNERFDEGEIIRIKKFPIDQETICVKKLEMESQRIGYELIMEVINGFMNEERPTGISQKSGGGYYSRADFEQLKIINDSDSVEEIERKIRACWCPPYEGAYILKDNKKFFLISSEILDGLKADR